MATSEHETVLMIDQRQAQLIPMSTHAFAHASGSLDAARSKNIGNLVVHRSGIVRRILDIERSVATNPGLISRLYDKLAQAIAITTKLSEPTSVPFSEMKDLIRDLVRRDAASPEPYLQPNPDFDSQLISCNTWEDAFQILNVPTPENALDVMC